ncbi:hypothetical protein ACFFHF_16665 [Robertmurraya beringensis]|uniref:Uncharacterized protein n=1 Tax=Robertmurraya beringensis TaxID=641660 RepID=A0ABV6KV04_9BACI
MRYSELSKSAKHTAREQIIIDSREFEFEGAIQVTTHVQAHKDLVYHNDENNFDEKGIVISNGGCYAG